MSVLHAVFVRLNFDQGISVGRGSDLNLLTIDMDGRGRPILRGTALAGAIRSRLARELNAGDDQTSSNVFETASSSGNHSAVVKYWFGYALGDGEQDKGYRSRVRLEDSTLATHGDQKVTRVHHQRNRHTGVVTDGGLYTLETCPPGTTTDTVVWIEEEPENPHAAHPVGQGEALVAWLVKTLASGVILGGRSARGVGLGKVAPESVVYRRFDLSDAADHADYLDIDRNWRQARQRPHEGQPLPSFSDAAGDQTLRVSLALEIPRGQDLLVAEGTLPRPMQIASGENSGHWLIPGGTLRGLLRDWFNRLAAREGLEIDDSAAAFAQLDYEAQKRHPNVNTAKHPNCPINDLFGTTTQAGRIKVTDALAVYHGSPKSQLQKRMHVAVDRITGGAADKLLFENEVLVSGGANAPVFHLEIHIEKAREQEARWLGQTLQAIHLGLLRVGSSKSSGRLRLSVPPTATGPFSDVLLQNLPQTE